MWERMYITRQKASTMNDSMTGASVSLNPFSYHPTKCQKTASKASRSLLIIHRYAPRPKAKLRSVFSSQNAKVSEEER